MNMVTPNDLLAQRVIEIAKGNRSGDAFTKGMPSYTPVHETDDAAMGTFGKFPEEAVLSLHQRILAHEALASASSGGSMSGMDHDVLAAEPRRKGGLRPSGAAPKFKTPAPRASLLGLDKLAAEKRAQAAEPPSKRFRVEEPEEGAGGVFKGKL